MIGSKFPYFKQKQKNMPDISCCKGGSCLLRLNCHRYTVTPDELNQTYFKDPPYKLNIMLDEYHQHVGVVTLSCPYFWNNEKYENEKPGNKSRLGEGVA
jgi:hypothetical protein